MSFRDSISSNSLEEETGMKKLSLSNDEKAIDFAIAFDFKSSNYHQITPLKLSDQPAGRDTSRFMTVKEKKVPPFQQQNLQENSQHITTQGEQ